MASAKYPHVVETALKNAATTEGGAHVVDLELKSSPQNGALIAELKRFADSTPGMKVWQEEATEGDPGVGAVGGAGVGSGVSGGPTAGAGAPTPSGKPAKVCGT